MSKKIVPYFEALLVILARTDEKCPKYQPRLVVIIPPVGDVNRNSYQHLHINKCGYKNYFKTSSRGRAVFKYRTVNFRFPVPLWRSYIGLYKDRRTQLIISVIQYLILHVSAYMTLVRYTIMKFVWGKSSATSTLSSYYPQLIHKNNGGHLLTPHCTYFNECWIQYRMSYMGKYGNVQRTLFSL